jgi:hypothetical protein
MEDDFIRQMKILEARGFLEPITNVLDFPNAVKSPGSPWGDDICRLLPLNTTDMEIVRTAHQSVQWGSNFEKQWHKTACSIASATIFFRGLRDLCECYVKSDIESELDSWNVVKSQEAVENYLFAETDVNSNTHADTKVNKELESLSGCTRKSFYNVTQDDMRKRGMTLEELCYHIQTKFTEKIDCIKIQGDPIQGLTLDDVRSGNRFNIPTSHMEKKYLDIIEHEITHNGGCMVNYLMAGLGQWGQGHFAVAVAIGRKASATTIEERGDRHDGEYFIALLDPWPETPCCWVPLKALLTAAVGTNDTTSRETRGIIQVVYKSDF